MDALDTEEITVSLSVHDEESSESDRSDVRDNDLKETIIMIQSM